LFQWIFVYFAYSSKTNTAVYHVRFQDHVATGKFKNVFHIVPYWFGFYLGQDPFYTSFNGKMSNFFIDFGKDCFYKGKWREIYDPRPPEMVIDLSKITGKDLNDQYHAIQHGEEVPVYGLDIPPELLDDVSDYYISFWYRHSQNAPIENPKWADVFRKCFNVFRVRETETGDDSNLGDRSLQLLVCGGRDGKLNLRAVTYDVDSNNSNLGHDENILFSELEGTWIYVYAGYSKVKATMSTFVKIPRTERTIFISVPAVHHETTEKLRLDVGWDDYIAPLQSKYFDLNFHWGPDGEFL